MKNKTAVKESGTQVIARRLKKQLKAEIKAGMLRDAHAADERAAELAGESGLNMDSDGFDLVLGELCAVAGKCFPGDWED